MASDSPVTYSDVERCVDDILAEVGKKIVLGLPLGLGKPNQLVNALYQRAKQDPAIELTICTALSLEKPGFSSDLERRFMEPFVERVFSGVPDLDYMTDMRRNQLPPNVQLREFYAKAGAYLGLRHAQQNYTSSNYTHVYRDLLNAGANVAAQIVAVGQVNGERRFSLSCNPDVTLDLAKALHRQREQGRKLAIVAQVNQNLPFMYGDAVVEPDLFTAVIDNPDYYFRLFGAPKMAVTTTDYFIGLHASALIKDGGTLQIGIGSLGDALCYGLQVRQEHNEVYRMALDETGITDKFKENIDEVGGVDRFDKGLFGCTEMFVDGYLHLMKSGVVKRRAYNHEGLQRLLNEGRLSERITPESLDTLMESRIIQPLLSAGDAAFLRRFGFIRPEWRYEAGQWVNGGNRIPADLSDPESRRRIVAECLGDQLRDGILIQGGFFLGPESFYQALRDMTEDERRRIQMTSVLNVNHLYENEYASEELKVLQRQHGRFVNACLMVTLSGSIVSDGLENGQMVSGVGGQYNFVSQAHELPDGRAVLMCKAVRSKGKEVHSNIVFNYGHITVPRHLRDLVVTEYGIADLRGKSDREIIASLINIADSRFQQQLLQQAKDARKIEDSYEVPEVFRYNLPERLNEKLSLLRKQGYFPAFPFGTDFTAEELAIGKALKGLKARMGQGMGKVGSLGKAMTMRKVPEEALPYLKRLQLDNPANSRERMMQKLVIYALSLTGAI